MSSNNSQDGINAGSTAHVRGCVAASNGLAGIRVGSFCSVINNTCDFNEQSTATAGSLIIRNSVSGSTPAYQCANGSFVGPIINPPPSLPIPANPAAGVGTANPWANFSY